jgi:predicted nucleic acid-binding protein
MTVVRGEGTTIVLADTSVLVNLAIVNRFDLLGALEGFLFRVPDEVVAEVARPEQRDLLNRALGEGHVEETSLTGVATIVHFHRLRLDLGLGRGEAACLALGCVHGWMVASDERRVFRREARRLLGEERLLDTPELFVLGIRQHYWTTADADRCKEVLERNRFRMRFGSFEELMRRREPEGEVW